MTKRSAHRMVREAVDGLHGAHEPGLGPAVAERAYGIVQRKLAEQDVDLSMDERLALMAYAHGYTTAVSGVTEDRGHDLERFEEHHAAGVKAGGS